MRNNCQYPKTWNRRIENNNLDYKYDNLFNNLTCTYVLGHFLVTLLIVQLTGLRQLII